MVVNGCANVTSMADEEQMTTMSSVCKYLYTWWKKNNDNVSLKKGNDKNQRVSKKYLQSRRKKMYNDVSEKNIYTKG